MEARYAVPSSVRLTARFSVALSNQGFHGGTQTGHMRARQLSHSRHVPDEDVRVMRAWFARHRHASYPKYKVALRTWLGPLLRSVLRRSRTPAQAARLAAERVPAKSQWRGAIAWLLWGGDAGEAWVSRLAGASRPARGSRRRSPRRRLPRVLRGGRKLCDRGVKAAKKRFSRWPSAYASGHASQVCLGKIKDLSGKKRVDKRYAAATKAKKQEKGVTGSGGLSRWFKEKWVDVCTALDGGKPKPCGRSSSSRSYPYCRPSVRVTKDTPVTWKEMSKQDRVAMCNKKKDDPAKVMARARRSGKRSARRSGRR